MEKEKEEESLLYDLDSSNFGSFDQNLDFSDDSLNKLCQELFSGTNINTNTITVLDITETDTNIINQNQVLEMESTETETETDSNIINQDQNLVLVDNKQICQHTKNPLEYIVTSDEFKLDLKKLLKQMRKYDEKMIFLYDEKENSLYISKHKQFAVKLYSDSSYTYTNQYFGVRKNRNTIIYFDTLDFLITSIHPLFCKENRCKFRKILHFRKIGRITYLKEICQLTDISIIPFKKKIKKK